MQRDFFQADLCSVSRNGTFCRHHFTPGILSRKSRKERAKIQRTHTLSLSFGPLCTNLTTWCEAGLTNSVSPDNTMCTCNSGNAQMLKGLGERFHEFARLSYKVLRGKSFLTNASND